MKKLLITCTLLLILLGTYILPFTVYASSPASVVLTKEQVIDKDYFAVGDTVTLAGTVNGDAYLAGGNIIVTGVVNGDLLAAGGTITVIGKVTQNIRVAGGQITLSGDVGRNVTAAGGTVAITNSAIIHGSLTSGAGNITVLGPIDKQVTLGAGQVTLGNSIGGDVQAGVGQITLIPTASVSGDLHYWSDTKAVIASDASVSGTTVHTIPPKQNHEVTKKTTSFPVFSLFSFLAALLIGILFVSYAPIYAKKTANNIITKPLITLGTGFLSLIIFPFAFVLILITIIGIPLDLMLLFGFSILIYFAKIIVGLAIGDKVLSYLKKPLTLRLTFTIGLTIYYIITLIPILGFLFWIITGCMGLGALILQKKETFTEFQEKKLL